jgi:hypothetical protein
MVALGCTRNSLETQGHVGLYWFRPSESKTLCTVGIVLLVFEGKDFVSSEGHPRPPYIGWRTRVFEVGGPRVQIGYNVESYLYGLQTISRDIRTGGRRCAASCVLFCTPSVTEVSGVMDKVFWAHMQIGGSSDRSDPLVTDL